MTSTCCIETISIDSKVREAAKPTVWHLGIRAPFQGGFVSRWPRIHLLGYALEYKLAQ